VPFCGEMMTSPPNSYSSDFDERLDLLVGHLLAGAVLKPLLLI